MKKEDETVLKRAERAMIRRICGVKVCERKHSDELIRMVGLELDIIVVVKQSRLRWYCHVKRREENEIRKVLEWRVDGARSKGRPSLTWEALLKRDMKEYGIHEAECEDREKWRNNVCMLGETRLPP